MSKIISLWSGPRNISTALMYSFAQRSDMQVIDEPLYGHYLNVTDAVHPGRQEILDDMETDPVKVWEKCNATARTGNVFLKNMGHHAIELSENWFKIPEPVFLIRDPRDMLPSLAKVLDNPVLRDTGLPGQVEILEKVRSAGKKPVVIEGADILRNPADMLGKLCAALDIPNSDTMQHWTPGKLPEDGIWAKYWYDQVHKSSGFHPWKPGKSEVPSELQPLLEECIPYYTELKTLKLYP